MTCLSFKARFVDPILSGRKDQTIRNPRKVPPKVGRPMHLFTGMRTKHCRKIAVVTCTGIVRIELSPFQYGGYVRLNPANDTFVTIDQEFELDGFAWRDGFESWPEMCDFWQEQHGAVKFHGEVYRWEPLQP